MQSPWPLCRQGMCILTVLERLQMPHRWAQSMRLMPTRLPESDPDSGESSLDSVHPGSIYSDSGMASQSDIKSPPSTDPGDALTDNEGELPSDSASLSSVHAGDAFSETSSPPHLSGLSDIEMQDKPNSPAMPPGHVANLSSPESSLAIGSHLHGFETRGPFTASSFADIPTDWHNLDECEEDPDAPENLAPGD